MTSDNFRLSNSLLRDMPLRVAHVGAPTLLTRTSSGPKATTAPAPKHPLPPRSIPAPASLRNTRSLNKWSEVAASTRRDLLLASVGTAYTHITLLRTSPRALDAKSPNELSAHHLQPLQHQICPALYGIELAVFTGLNMTSDNFRLSNSLLRDMPLRVAHVGAPTLLTRTSSGPKATTAPAPKHPLPPRSIPAPASLRNTRSLNKWSEVAASTRRDLLLASVGTAYLSPRLPC